jgi:hypothetical protein
VVGLLVFVALLALGRATDAQPAALLVDHGGRVLTAPQVSAIYLGDFWAAGQGAGEALHTDAFLQAWLAGPSVTDVLAQYRVASASFASANTVPGASPAQFTDADAQALLQQEIAAGRVVAGEQMVHVVFLPPGTILTFQGVSSQGRLTGYHSSFPDTASGSPVLYAVVVYNQGGNGVDFTGVPQDNASIVASRVLAGAFTNPEAGAGTAGWLDDLNGEVGDVAFALSTDSALRDVFVLQSGFAVALLWSNKDERLTTGVATTPPPSPTALTITPATQTATPGSSLTYTVTNPATAVNTLTLAVSGLPTGATGVFAAPSLAPGASTTLTITVAADAPLTTSATFTVTGTTGAATETATATIAISTTASPPAAQAADFTVTVTPTSQEMVRGGPVAVYTITTTQVGTGVSRLKLKTSHVLGRLKAYLSTKRMVAGESATIAVSAHRNAKRKTYDFKLKVSSDQGDQLIVLTLTVR